ncbi:MAG: hypothetical protein HKN59_09750 [Gammaproteobacteria bacterium]|nr:hypothetical protein [Gammaproteobacteria bacterium]
MKRATLVFAGLLALTVVVVGAGFAWLFASESGLRFVVARVVGLAPAQITYAGVSGNLLGGFSVADLEILGVGPEIRVTQASTALAPWPLLRGQIALKGAQLRSVAIRAAVDEMTTNDADESVANAVDDTPFSFPEPALPFGLLVSELDIRELSFETRGDEAVERRTIDKLTAAELRFTEPMWSVSGLEIVADKFSGAGDLRYAAGADHSVSINFKSRIQDADKYIEINTIFSGNEERIQLEQRFEGLVRGALLGSVVAPVAGPRWSLEANLQSDKLQAISSSLPGGPLSLTVGLEGENADLKIRGTGSAPAEDLVLAFEAELADLRQGMEVRSLSLSDAGSDAKITFSGSLKPLGLFPQIDGQVQWSNLRWPLRGTTSETVAVSPAGVFRVQGQEGQYEIDGNAELESESTNGALSSRGKLDFALPVTAFSLSGTWDRMQVRVPPRAFLLKEGQYRLDGNLDSYLFEAGLIASTGNSPELRVEVTGQGSPEVLIVSDLVANSSAGSLLARGNISLAETRDFDFSIEGSNINTGAFDPRWPGQVALAGSVSGRFDGAGTDARLDARLDATSLRGTLRGLAIKGSGHATLAKGALSEIDVSGSWGNSALLVRGKLGEQRDLRWQLDVPDLASHTERGAGSFASEGRLSGSRNRPVIVASAEVRNLQYVDIAAAKVDLTASINQTGAEASSLRVSAADVSWKDQTAEQINLEALGTQLSHSGSLALNRKGESLQTRFSGMWQQGEWRGEFGDTAVTLAESVWTQENPSRLVIGRSGVELSEACLVQNTSRACLQLNFLAGASPEFDLTIDALPIAKLSMLLPSGLGYSGDLSGKARLGGGNGTARFNVTGARVWQEIANEEQVLLDFASMLAVANLDGNRLALELTGTEPGQQEMRLVVNLPFSDWRIGEGPVSGRMQGRMAHLGAVSFLFPDLGDLSGRLETDLSLGGTVARPSWTGEIVLNEGKALVPSLGIALGALSARLTAEGRQLSGEISAVSGDGLLRLSGTGEPGNDGFKGRFELRGEKFLASDLPEARLILSPELDVTIEGRNVGLVGKVHIDEARIEPRDLSAAIQKSPDARVISQTGEPVPEERWAITSRVAVSLSDQVFFKGFGLESRISGSLNVADAPDAVTTATGELETVDGTYEVYGRKLVIRRGRLLFGGGPLANPGLDVMAARSIDAGLEVGVLVRANLKAPQITLYSEPSMSSSQTLSYLLVGQPLADIGSADRQLVNDTALRLATAGGGLLAQQFGRRLGLEDITIASTSDSEQASLVIGKYLSPRLYASYGIGLFEPVNTLRLRYLLSSKWTVRAESGLNQAVDLEYTLDR